MLLFSIHKSVYNIYLKWRSALTILIPDTVFAKPERFSRGRGYRRLFPTGKAGQQYHPHHNHHLVDHHPMDRLCRSQFRATAGHQSLVKEVVQACLPLNHGDPWPLESLGHSATWAPHFGQNHTSNNYMIFIGLSNTRIFKTWQYSTHQRRGIRELL